MIIIRFKGGLGNQLFQYALYRRLELDGKEVLADITVYQNTKERNKMAEVREYELEDLGIHLRLANQEQITALAGKENFINKIYRRLGLRRTFYCEKDAGYDSLVLSKDQVYLNGYWQSEAYFINIRDNLLDNIKLILPEKLIDRELYQIICSTQSVCVTVRCGAFLKNKEVSKSFLVCDVDYFERCIKAIRQEMKDVAIVVFSDDVEWTKQNMNLGNQVYYENGAGSLSEKLRLMSACKHFVLSNSSFSWWAQYLSQNDDKIVYAPEKWYADGRRCDIHQDNWRYLK